MVTLNPVAMVTPAATATRTPASAMNQTMGSQTMAILSPAATGIPNLVATVTLGPAAATNQTTAGPTTAGSWTRLAPAMVSAVASMSPLRTVMCGRVVPWRHMHYC
ncbi:hypothetical protein BDW59DRAFT_137433 [Aspergillus cavernicola]|uniref:Uncharacterized protein n=1 Tax=Aspergillus cavernicola TaxID=176166 RepID=A0ABR4J5G0_9EURO